nr:hypothetical protein [Tanacetum cinerariifolium]
PDPDPESIEAAGSKGRQQPLITSPIFQHDGMKLLCGNYLQSM